MNRVREYIQKKQKIVDTCILLVLSWLGVYGISYFCSLVEGSFFSNSILSVAVFIMLYKFLEETKRKLAAIEDVKGKKRHICYTAAIAFLFALSLVMGYQLRGNGMTECGFRGKGMIVVNSLCLSAAVFPFVNILVDMADCMKNGKALKADEQKRWGSGKVFLICWLLLFISWFPVFLAYYPSVMAFDFHRQSIEAMKGFIWFNSHHPLIHTWLIWVFLQLGKAVGSLEAGMACYSIFQMLLLSAALAYAAVMVYRLTKKKWALVAVMLFFAFFPFISVLSIGATKDIIFSALFVVFTLLLIERTLFAEGKKRWIIDALLVLEGIFMILFRNNALYAIAVFAILFVILVGRKERIRALALCIVIVIGGKLALEGMQLAIGTEGRGSAVEKYSVLIQQFARVGYYHNEEMDPETRILLDTYVSEEYWQSYNPPLADTVKNWVAVDNFVYVWKDNMPDVIRAWVKLGLQYPNEYIDAFLCLTNGYWFIDDLTWAEMFGFDLEGRMGAVPTYTSSTSDEIPEGIAHVSKLPWLENFMENIITANGFYGWPVFSVFFKPALYCWILLICFILFIYTKQKKKYMLTSYSLIYLMTMFLGPTVQTRYVLPIIVVVPVLLALWNKPDTEENAEEF